MKVYIVFAADLLDPCSSSMVAKVFASREQAEAYAEESNREQEGIGGLEYYMREFEVVE